MFTESPDTRRARKSATARKVLLAARDAFEREGFEAASVRGIARDAGVAVGTVLKHYGDKRQLLFAALHEALEEALDVAATTARAQAARGNVVSRLLGIAESMFDVYRARPRLGKTLLREALFADGAWGARFVEQTGRAHDLIARAVHEGVARGELAETDAEELGLAFLSYFYFALVSWAQNAPLPFGPMGLIERLLVGRLGLTPTRSRRRKSALTPRALPELTPTRDTPKSPRRKALKTSAQTTSPKTPARKKPTRKTPGAIDRRTRKKEG